MSFYVSAYVWEHSSHKGAELLLMLAIADIAHKNGVAFPSVKTLSGYIRMSERQTTRLIQRCESSGELKVKRNGGPHGTHLFQVVMNTTLPLFEGGDKLSGDKPPSWGVTKPTTRGDVAMSPEPTEQKKNRIAAGASPSPVSLCFQALAEGFKKRYGVEYPPSARVNGQLGHIVKTIGADPALAVVRYYLQSDDAWYRKVRHSVDFLVRDCVRLWMDVQMLSAGSTKTPTHADIRFLGADGEARRDIGRFDVGEPFALARKAMADYASRIDVWKVAHVEVRVGAGRHVYSLDELKEPAHA